jgi:hypothetical protein
MFVTLPCLLALAAPAWADIFTVPPGASIQTAVDAAIAAGGDNEVRVAAGHFVGKITIDGIDSGGSADGDVLVATNGVAEVDVVNFSITGSTSGYGAIGQSPISVRDNIVRDNHLLPTSGWHGAGIRAYGWTVDSHLDISGNRVTGNSGTTSFNISGIAMFASSRGQVRVASNQIRGNSLDGDGGLAFVEGGTLDVSDNGVEWNGLGARPSWCCRTPRSSDRLRLPAARPRTNEAPAAVVHGGRMGEVGRLVRSYCIGVGSLATLTIRGSQCQLPVSWPSLS